MNYYNDIMRKEIKNRENFDEQTLDDIKSSFTDFNKQMRQTTFNREQSEGQLIDLVDATISQFVELLLLLLYRYSLTGAE